MSKEFKIDWDKIKEAQDYYERKMEEHAPGITNLLEFLSPKSFDNDQPLEFNKYDKSKPSGILQSEEELSSAIKEAIYRTYTSGVDRLTGAELKLDEGVDISFKIPKGEMLYMGVDPFDKKLEYESQGTIILNNKITILDKLLKLFSPTIPLQVKGNFIWKDNDVVFEENINGKFTALRNEEGYKVMM